MRLLLIGVMLASLLMAVAIPEAFGDRALLFAGSYVAIQVGRHAFLTFAAAEPGRSSGSAPGASSSGSSAAGVLWIAGALADGPARDGALAGRRSRSTTARRSSSTGCRAAAARRGRVGRRDRALRGALPALHHHRARRVDRHHRRDHGGARARPRRGSRRSRSPSSGRPRCGGCTSTTSPRIAQRRLELAADRTRLARDGYTYLHVVMVAGIIVAAVGDELVIAHPTEELPAAEVAAVVAGPALYLARARPLPPRMAGTRELKRLGGAIACLAVGARGRLRARRSSSRRSCSRCWWS